MVGLGRMGKNMTLRLLEHGHSVVVWNRSPEPVKEVRQKGAIPASDFTDLVSKLSSPKIIWVMLPPSEVTKSALTEFSNLLQKKDILIDGGNSRYTDSIEQANRCQQKGILFLDIGVSGGIIGREKGYCLMVGGEKTAFDAIEPILQSLAQPNGYRLVGQSGAGHFVKMVHNGIEYAMMQGISEGFNLLKNGPFSDLNLFEIADLWQHGSIVESFLVEKTRDALKKDSQLKEFSGEVQDSGEGQWAIETALFYKIPLETITAALFSRYHSRGQGKFGHRVLSGQRKQFGGHEEKKE